MADTKRALHEIQASPADLELVDTLLASRSGAESVFAYTMLRSILPSRALVMLANLREIIALLPDPPFATGTGLDALVSANGYESTGRSYRRLFEDESGTFGLEFVGGGTLCEGIMVHLADSRFCLHGNEQVALDSQMLAALVSHQSLLDAVLEGLQTIGLTLDPPIYVTPDDFLSEHGASAAGEALGNLF